MRNVLILMKGPEDLSIADIYKNDTVTIVSCIDANTDFFKYRGFNTYSATQFFSGEIDMKFDIIVGNPPYGKNSNLAIKFLNKCGELSNNIHLVLPKTVRKASYLNRINPYLHLVSDIDNPDDTFGGGIITCTQYWAVNENIRNKIERISTHPDFEFVKKDEADIFIGRVGAGPCAKVKTKDFLHYKNDHYYLKVKDESVIKRLQDLYPLLRSAACETVGMPCLSKHDLITIYSKSFENNESSVK